MASAISAKIVDNPVDNSAESSPATRALNPIKEEESRKADKKIFLYLESVVLKIE